MGVQKLGLKSRAEIVRFASFTDWPSSDTVSLAEFIATPSPT